MLISSNPLDNQQEYKEIKNGVKKVVKINDIIGEALPRIGTYKDLDNTKQVVALIDDVIYFFTYT